MNGLQLLGWLALVAYVVRAVVVDWRASRPLLCELCACLPDGLAKPVDVSVGHMPHSECHLQVSQYHEMGGFRSF